MTGRDLVLEAIDGNETERVPWVPFCGVHSGQLIGKTADEMLRNTELVVQAQEKAIERYSPDGIPVIFDLQVEAEILGCELNWAEDNPPAVVSHPLEADASKLSELHIPAPDEGRLPLALDATKRLREAHPDIALYGLITGPFTLALHLRGPTIFTDMFDDPDGVNELLDFCASIGKKVSSYYLDAGCDVIAMVDPMTSQIGPDQFRQFCTAPSTGVFDAIHEKGGRGSFFVCGHAQRNIEAMCDTHCDNVSIDENIPLDYVRDVCRNKGISFGGNLQLTVVMLTGEPDDNRRNAIECMDTAGNTGFILSPGCDIPYSTPPENIEAIAEVVHDEYKREIAHELLKTEKSTTPAYDMSEYGAGEKVVVDIITLDSEACAPCQYMVESVKQVAPQFEGIVEWREHKIKSRESIDMMTSFMVRNVPTICIDGVIKFVSTIPPRDELIAAIQQRINEKMRNRITRQTRVIRVCGPPTEECLETRKNVQKAIKELGADVTYQEIEDPEECARYGIAVTPAVAIARQHVKSVGRIPQITAIKEWLKQLSE